MHWQLIFFPGVLVILSLTWLSWRLVVASQTVAFHEDEHTYVMRSQFADLYFAGDFSHPLWRTYASYDDPKFAQIFYGLVIKLATGRNVTEYVHSIPYFPHIQSPDSANWIYEYSRDFCCSLQELPPVVFERIEPIRTARVGAVIVAVLTLITVFALGRLAVSWWFGLIAMVLIGTHPLFIESSVRAMGDGPLILFSLVSGAVGLWLWRQNVAKVKLRQIGVWGAVVGLAIAIKFNAILQGMWGVVVLSLAFMTDRLQTKEWLQKVVVFGVGAALAFISINPYLWSEPLKSAQTMAAFRASMFPLLAQLNPQDVLGSPGDRLRAAYSFLLTPTAQYRHLPVLGVISLDLVLLLGGLGVLLRKKPSSQYFWWWVLWLGGLTVLLVPLNWGRYFLPVAVSVCFVQAYAIEYVRQKLVEKL